MLRLESVLLRRDEHFALTIEKLQVNPGEKVTLLGPSGSGKSTLIRVIAGLEDPQRGAIHIAGREVTHESPHSRQLSLLAQDFGLWPHLTAMNHLAFARTSGRSLKSTKSDSVLLKFVHLEHKSATLPGFLSGGERQRLALARALARQPQLLLLDEPFSNVDRVLAAELESLLEEIHEPWNLTRIQVRHWMSCYASAAERYIVMESGRIVQDGSWQNLKSQPLTEWTRRYVSLIA